MKRLVCSKCDFESSDPNAFAQRGGKPQGYCKECHNAAMRDYRARKKAEISAWRKQYREENGDRIREQKRESYRRNRERHIESVTRWQQENPDRVKAARRNVNARRRSQMSDTDITAEFLRSLLQNTSHCELCAEALAKDATSHHHPQYPNLDHIMPLTAGGKHVTSNVRYICRTCNVRRPHDGSDL